MTTTILNATVLLLAATFVAAVRGIVRGQDARTAFATTVRFATAWPVLLLLAGLAGAGLASRAVVGFFSPGAYAEETVAARAFLEDRSIYAIDDDRTREWVGDATTPLPWGTLPGMTSCQTDALEQRAQFYTSHAHTPVLLLAGISIVALAGSKGLYVALVAASLGSIAVMATLLLRIAERPLVSRESLLLVTALAGWQPVLAAIKQGDAVLPAAGLVLLAWYLAREHQTAAGGGLAAGVASALALPALGILPALVCTRRRAGVYALACVAAAVALVSAVAGVSVWSTFIGIAVDTGRVYAPALTNYAIGPRIAALHPLPLVVLLIIAAASLTSSSLRTADKAFAVFIPLGLAFAPVVWSQHLVLLLVPSVVLLASVLRHGSSAALAAWTLLVLLLSLPDGITITLSALLPLSVGGLPIPIVSVALAALAIWAVMSTHREARASTAPAIASATPLR